MSVWVKCPKCGHKLFLLQDGKILDIEIKCSSCKAIVSVKTIGTEVVRETLKDK